VLVTYKADSESSGTGGPDPMFGVNNSVVTTLWRDPIVARPEDAMMGEMWGGQLGPPNGADYVVKNASNWVYAGTGFSEGTHVPNLVNYEYDKVYNDASQPSNVTVLSASPLTTNFGTSDTANSTIYQAPSGAWVFDAGDITWSQGLDNFGGTTTVSAGIQRMTANILDAFTGALTPPAH
jgi:hypothetical protein